MSTIIGNESNWFDIRIILRVCCVESTRVLISKDKKIYLRYSKRPRVNYQRYWAVAAAVPVRARPLTHATLRTRSAEHFTFNYLRLEIFVTCSYCMVLLGKTFMHKAVLLKLLSGCCLRRSILSDDLSRWWWSVYVISFFFYTQHVYTFSSFNWTPGV